MRIINWTLAVIIAFCLIACTSGTDNTKKHEVVTKTTTENTQAVTETTTDVAETVENTSKAQPLADAKAQDEKAKTTSKEDASAKQEKPSTSKPKQVVEKIKETTERTAEKAKTTTQKAVQETKEVVQNTTTAATETVAKTTETITKTLEPAKEKATPPPPRKVETKPEPIVEKPTPKVEEKPIPKPKLPLSHEAWDALLRKHVSSTGSVNYSGFKSDMGKFQDYLDLLANNSPQPDWGRSKTMAYWINAYNAFTVKLIVDNHPLGSITDLEGGKPWSKRWIKLGDQTYSLDQIEKEILLKKYKDARVHFAVNCAAKSCPALLNQAWTAGNLESNFDRQTKSFINNSQFNEIKPKSAKVSQLFNWYASDFGDVKTFINKYSNTQLKSNAKLDFMEYNWKLNE